MLRKRNKTELDGYSAQSVQDVIGGLDIGINEIRSELERKNVTKLNCIGAIRIKKKQICRRDLIESKLDSLQYGNEIPRQVAKEQIQNKVDEYFTIYEKATEGITCKQFIKRYAMKGLVNSYLNAIVLLVKTENGKYVTKKGIDILPSDKLVGMDEINLEKLHTDLTNKFLKEK